MTFGGKFARGAEKALLSCGSSTFVITDFATKYLDTWALVLWPCALVWVVFIKFLSFFFL